MSEKWFWQPSYYNLCLPLLPQVLSYGRHVQFRAHIRVTHVDANVQLRVAQDTLGRVALITYGNDQGTDPHEPSG